MMRCKQAGMRMHAAGMAEGIARSWEEGRSWAEVDTGLKAGLSPSAVSARRSSLQQLIMHLSHLESDPC